MKKMLCAMLLLLGATTMLNAQEKWVLHSKYLHRPDTVLVYKPENFNPGNIYPLVYLLHGYGGDYHQWSRITNLQEKANQYGFIIVTPDGYKTWYINSPYDQKSQMEDFFFKILVPKVHQTFHIDDRNIFIAGLSMGGYGALHYFILHQDYFNTAGSLSGALNIDFDTYKKVSLLFFNNTSVTDDVTRLLGDHRQNDWHRYSIPQLLKNHPISKPFLLSCGTEDVLYPATIAVKHVAESRDIPITFITAPGIHDAHFWNKAIDYQFVYFRQQLKK